MKKRLLLSVMFPVMAIGSILAQGWQPIGPVNRTNNASGLCQGAGRVDAITFDANYSLNKIVYAASPFGGVWQGNWNNFYQKYIWTNTGISTDNVAVSNPATQIPGCGATDIVADHTNSGTLYAALAHHRLTYAIGVYKYTTATGWTPTGLQFSAISRNRIYRLTMDPSNSNVVYACTDIGIYRTTDGGQSWNGVNISGNPDSFYNLAFQPGSPSVVYAAGSEVYKSTDGGQTWTISSNFAATYSAMSMTPIMTNISVASNGRVYAGIYLSDPQQQCAAGSAGNYCMDIQCLNGPTWQILPMFGLHVQWALDRMTMAVDPSNPDILYMGQEHLHRLNYNGGNPQWNYMSSYCDALIHADMHDIEFAPDGKLFIGHDGGITMGTGNIQSGTPILSPQNTDLNIATVRAFSGTDADNNEYLVGEDDNGNSLTTNGDPNNFGAISWNGYRVTDGGNKLIDYSNSLVWYDENSSYTNVIYRSLTGNPSTTQVFTGIAPYEFKEFGVIEPLIQDPVQPNIIYKASNFLSKSTDQGNTSTHLYKHGDCDPTPAAWYTVITDVAIPKVNPEYVYITTYNNQTAGYYPTVLKTTQASSCPGAVCACWTEITPPWPTGLANQEIAQLYISSVVASELNPDRVWVGYRYSPHSSSYKVKVFDGVWKDYGTGLPDGIDIECMVYERGSNDGIYLGTSSGIYYRDNSMTSWVLFSTNDFPRVPVTKLQINYAENTVRAGTYGRGIWKSPLHCPSQVDVTETGTITGGKFVEASNSITAQNLTITNADVKFRAGAFIDFLPDFLVDANSGGGRLLGYIHNCSGPGNSFREGENVAAGSSANLEQVIEQMSGNDIVVMPNPNNGKFVIARETFEGSVIGSADLYIYDIMGKLIYSENNSLERFTEIDLTMQPKGIYLVKSVMGNRVSTVKVINQ